MCIHNDRNNDNNNNSTVSFPVIVALLLLYVYLVGLLATPVSLCFDGPWAHLEGAAVADVGRSRAPVLSDFKIDPGNLKFVSK